MSKPQDSVQMTLSKMNEWVLGAEMQYAIKEERYHAAERIRLEIKRRIDEGIIDDLLFGEMVRSEKFRSKIDPVCFFE